MKSLDIIKRRINSVRTTSKITGAMKLVATAKIKRQMTDFKSVSTFCNEFYEIIESIVKTMPSDISDKDVDQTKPKLWIVVTSSLGLCGAYNINVCKHLMGVIQPNDKIIVIGRKGFSILKNKGLEKSLTGPMEFSDVGINYLELLPTSEQIIQMFYQKIISSANIVYTKFINSLSFEPRHIQVLPLEHSLFKPDDRKDHSERVDLTDDHKEIMYEPTKGEILKSLTPIYLTTSIFAAIAESKVCENASRRNAMETATDNANQIMDELTLEYNQARQENITQEINEIVAGADGSQ